MAESSRKTPQQHGETVKRVAFLCAEGEPQKRIASLLSLSRPMVSRLVKQAKEKNLLREKVESRLKSTEEDRFREEIYGSETLLRKVTNLEYDSGVPSVSHLVIVPTGQEIKNDSSWDRAVLAFAQKAAPHCLEPIRQCRILGVTYGRTLAALAASLDELPTLSLKPTAPVQCVPLWGEPLRPWEKPTSEVFRDPAKLSSTGLAAAMYRAINERDRRGRASRSGHQTLSLDFVPAFQPERYPEDKFDTVLEFASSVSSYGDIFGTKAHWRDADGKPEKRMKSGEPAKGSGAVEIVDGPLVEHLDGIFTSVGSKDQPGRFWSGEFFQQGDINLTRLRRGALGDLGGVFIINPSAKKADREYVTRVNHRWTGVSEDHFRRCAVRARKHKLPGVVVFAVGATRAEVILRCVKLGLVNSLILDSDCAEKLNSLL